MNSRDTSRIRLDYLRLDDPAWETLAAGDGDLFRDWSQRWDSLAADEKDAFTHPAWIVAWLRGFAAAERDRYRLCVARTSQGVATAIPFALCSRAGLGLWLAHPQNPQTGGASLALARDQHGALRDALFSTPVRGRRRPVAVRFDRVDAGNALLTQDGARVREVRGRYRIDLEGGWEAVRGRLSRKFKNALRTSQNHLQRLPDVRFEEHVAGPGLRTAYERFIALESEGWKAQARDGERPEGRAIATREAFFVYYWTALELLSRLGRAAIYTLRSGDETLAAMLTFRHEDELVLVRIARSEAHQKYSPGHLMFAHVFENFCSDRGIRTANCVGRSEWVERWKPRTSAAYNVALFPAGLRGLAGRALALSARETLAPLARRLRPPAGGAPAPGS